MGFYDELSKYYDIIFPQGDAQLQFIKKRINGKNVLDLAAGTGNYTIALAKLDYHVVATDLDEEMVKHIEEKSREEKLGNIKARTLDMRDIHRIEGKNFDLIFCIGNSIVHLDNEEEIGDLIKKIYDLLNESGKVIIQIVNYDRILEFDVKNLPTIDRSKQGVKFIRDYELKDGKILFKTKLIVEYDQEYDHCVKLYPLTSESLTEMFVKAGFKEIEIFGGFDESEYNINSFATIAVAYK